MTAQQIGSSFDHVIHSGWFESLLAYGLVAVGSLAGLKRGGAGLRQYIAWPITSLVTAVVTFIVLALVGDPIHALGFNPPEAIVLISFLAAWMLCGVLGGLYCAGRARAFEPAYTRGAVVFDGTSAQKDTRRYAKSESGEGVLTLAGGGGGLLG